MKSELLIEAVYRKDFEEIEQLIAKGIGINATDTDGRSPLLHAILASDADPQMVTFLINRGATVQAHDATQQWTPLHFAARDQKRVIAEILLQAGAEPNAMDVFGNTPLWRCVFNKNPDTTLVRLLIDWGADPTAKNKTGVSPLDLANTMGRPDLVALLLK